MKSKMKCKKELIFSLVLTLFFIVSVNAQSRGDIVISEVMADPSSSAGLGEPANEYFVLCNRSSTSRNLRGWTVTDNGSATITLPAYTLAANACVVVANAGIDLTATGYNCMPAPTNVILAPTWFSNNLSNASDNLVLSTLGPGAIVIDAMSYGSDVTGFNPAASDVFNNTSTTLVRTGYPGNATTFPDTDSNGDWTSRRGTPCDVPIGPTAAPGTIQGRAIRGNGRGVKHAVVMLTGGGLEETIYATTNQFGYYQFQDIGVGQSYILQITSRRHRFQSPTRVINLEDSLTDEDFIVDEGDTIPSNKKDESITRKESKRRP